MPVAATALVLGILIGLGVLFAWRRSGAVADADRRAAKVLAVLPFENLGDSADAYFADGVTDEVRGKLAGCRGLAVIARGSSNEYRRHDQAPAADRPRAGGRLPAHRHGALGEARPTAPAGCG